MKIHLKSILLCCLALFSVTACNSDKFTINAELKDLMDQDVYLSADSENGMVYLDTVKAQNGKFTFTGKMDRNDFRTITFQNMAGEIRIYIDNSKMKLTGDFAQLDSVKVEGSPAMDYYKSFVEEEAAGAAFTNEKLAALRSAQQANDTAAMKQLTLQFMDYQKKYAMKLMEKVKKHPNDLISVIVFSNWMRFINPDEAVEYYEMIPEEVKTDFRVGKFNEFLRDKFVSLSKGREVPPFSLKKFEPATDTLTNKSLAGKPYVLYITAEQMDDNASMYPLLKKVADKGIDVHVALMYVGAAVPANVNQYIKDNGLEKLKFAIASDAFAADFVAMSPRAFFVDKDGKFIGTAMDAEQAEKLIGKL